MLVIFSVFQAYNKKFTASSQYFRKRFYFKAFLALFFLIERITYLSNRKNF